MEFTLANYTLPAMCHIVCTLVTTGISGVSIRETVTPASQSPQQQQPAVKLPEGYVAYPEIGSAYKVYDQNVTWPEAGASCLQEQAKLALIDSAEKLEYVKRQKLSGNWAHVGIIRILADHIWFAPYKGGMKLMESSLPWLDGAPSYSGDMDCVAIDFEGNGLGNYHCFSEANYVCEISLSQKETTIKQANQAFGPYSKFLG